MATRDNLPAVRLYTATDAYFYTTDNRPLTDLVASDQLLADTIDNLPSTLTFTQSGTGAVSRTSQAKMRERISIADFDTLAHALTAATGKRLIAAAVPSTITASTAIPASTVLDVEQGCALVFSGAGNITLSSNAGIISKSEGASGDVWYWGRNYTGSKSVGASSPQNLGAGPAGFMFDLRADDADASTDFVRALRGRTVFGGSSAKGGRIGVLGEILHQNGATNASNTNRNYQGVAGVANVVNSDGGTNTGAGAKGAYFGGGFFVLTYTGATNIFDAVGVEIDTQAHSASTMSALRCLSLVAMNGVRGTNIDAMLTFSGSANPWSEAHIGVKHCMLFTDFNTQVPTYASSALMGTYWTGGGTKTIAEGFQLSGFAITGAVLQTASMVMTNSALTLGTTANISLFAAGADVTDASLVTRSKGTGTNQMQDSNSVKRVEVDATGVRFTGTMSQGGTACVAAYGPAAVASITVKNGLITAIS